MSQSVPLIYTWIFWNFSSFFSFPSSTVHLACDPLSHSSSLSLPASPNIILYIDFCGSSPVNIFHLLRYLVSEQYYSVRLLLKYKMSQLHTWCRPKSIMNIQECVFFLLALYFFCMWFVIFLFSLRCLKKISTSTWMKTFWPTKTEIFWNMCVLAYVSGAMIRKCRIWSGW